MAVMHYSGQSRNCHTISRCTSSCRSPTGRTCRICESLPSLAHSQTRRDIPVLDHSLYLPPHRQKHQDQPVHHQDRPEHRQIEDLAPTAQKRESDRACRCMPELELRQSSHEGLELFVVLCGERGGLARGYTVLHVRILFEGGVELRGDEGEEEVEEVDTEGVGDWSAVSISAACVVLARVTADRCTILAQI